MRITHLGIVALSFFSLPAFAAADLANVPPGALNPPAYAPNKTMSIDNNLPNDGDLVNDAKTLEGIEGPATTDPTMQRLNNARTHYIRLNNQLGADIRNHASKETIQKERADIAAAKKQLDLDVKACDADAKAAGSSTTNCK